MTFMRWMWLMWACAGVGLEAIAIYRGFTGDTLSGIVWSISSRYPLLPLLLGMMMGHFFWQSGGSSN